MPIGVPFRRWALASMARLAVVVRACDSWCFRIEFRREALFFGKAMLMTYKTPTPAPSPCAHTMRDGLRQVYVSLKTHARAYTVGVLTEDSSNMGQFPLGSL